MPAETVTLIQKEKDELLARLVRNERDATAHWQNWRREAKENYNLYAGDQWEPEAKAQLAEQLRQPITFNRVFAMVNAVQGAETNNRQRVQYYPREVGDSAVNETLTATAKWVDDEGETEHEESEAFMDMTVCGLGWTETHVTFDTEVDGQILTERVDPLEMYPDPCAKKKNLRDRRWQFRVKQLDFTEFEDRWPGMADKIGFRFEDADGSNEAFLGPFDTTEIDDEDDVLSSLTCRRKIIVRHHQWFERRKVVRVFDPATGNEIVLTEAKFKQFQKSAEAVGIELDFARVPKRVFREAFVANGIIVQVRELPTDDFTFHCMTAARDRQKRVWFGLVRVMRDPQRWSNKWLSQALHIINSNAKGGLMAETDAFEDPDEAEQTWSQPDRITTLAEGALSENRVQEKPQMKFPAAMQQLIQFGVSSINDTAGVSPEFLGLTGINQPGVVEQARTQQGFNVLSFLFDALNLYRKGRGKVLLTYIQEYIPPGTLVRISGEDGNIRHIPFAKQPETIRFDVVVDEAPSSPNQKQAVWNIIQTMMPMLQVHSLPPESWAALMRYSPLPTAVAEKVIAPLLQPPDPQQVAAGQRQTQLALAAQEADIAKDQSTATLNQAKAQSELADAGIAPATAAQEVADAQKKSADARKRSAEAVEQEMSNAATALAVVPQPVLIDQ